MNQGARDQGFARRTTAGRVHEVIAEAPLGEMFNYVSALRSLSQGRASFTMTFARYAPLPKGLWDKALGSQG